MSTTTQTHDYAGRALINASPGVTDPARDYMARPVAVGDKDYLGRALQSGSESLLYGLSDDGEGGVLDELSTTPDLGFVVIDGVLQDELSAEWTHLFSADIDDELVEV